MSTFTEKLGEKQGQRRKRFLQFLRNLPMPKGTYDPKRKAWVPSPDPAKEKLA